MPGFIRVRAVDGPKHEFDAPAGEVDANPDLYEVLDAAVVEQPREPTYILPEAAATETPKPSVGDKEGEQS